jgi:hypothetical protein
MLAQRRIEQLRNNQTSGRRSIAANWKSAPEVLTLYASDPDPGVRMRVAANPNTPTSILVGLTEDEDPSVRKGLLSNVGRFPELLVTLARDPDPEVSREALSFLGVTSVSEDLSRRQVLMLLARTRYEEVALCVAQDSETPLPCLWDFTLSAWPQVRYHAGTHSALQGEGQFVLVADVDRTVRRQLAEREDLQPAVLMRLLCDPDPDVRSAASENPLVAEEASLQLAARLAEDYLRRPYSLAADVANLST